MAMRARQTGSAFTAWTFGPAGKEKVLALCQEVVHRSPQPVTGAVEVHPLNYLRPTEIIVPRAITHGEVTLTVLEQFNVSLMSDIAKTLGIENTINDLADLFNELMVNSSLSDANGSKLQLQRIIRDPSAAATEKWRTRTFKNARIVDVRDEEDTRVDTLVNPLTITVWYTHLTEGTSEISQTTSPVSNSAPVW